MVLASVWIRIGFKADPDPAFLSQCGSGFGETLNSQKVEFLHEKFTCSR
jgi:hypothetical protein